MPFEAQRSAEKPNLLRLRFEVLVVRMSENEIENGEAPLDEIEFVSSAITDVLAFNLSVEPAREHVIDNAALRKALDPDVPQALQFRPKASRSLSPMSPREFQKLPCDEVPRMRGHKVKKASLFFVVAEGNESFEMSLGNLHRERISAVRSRSLRMRRSRGASSAGL